VIIIRFFIAALISCSIATAQSGFQADWDRETALIVPRLDELAGWAQKQKLFRECIRTYELVIELQPDHLRGRRVLRYRRKGKGGPWERTRPFKEPRNLSDAALQEFLGKRAALVTPFANAVVASLEKHKDAIGGDKREQVLRALIRMDPDNKAARRAFGDVRTGDRWLPEDAVVAQVRRKELARTALEIRNATPAPTAAELTPADEALGIRFSEKLETGRVRVLTTSERSEASTIARYCHAAPKLFNQLLDTAARLPPGYTVFVLPTADDKKRFLDRHPDINSTNRKFLEQVAGGWVKGSTHLAAWSSDQPGRVDYCVRQTLALLFINDFGITMRQGWAWEGFGLYLTDLICATKLTYYVRPDSYGNAGRELRRKLMNPSTNWFSEGLALLKSDKRPGLGAVLTSDASGMSDRDMLIAYVIAAWMIETQPGKLRAILKTIAPVDENGHPRVPGPQAIQQHLGLDLETLDRRIIRWLEAVVSEMK